MSAHLLAAASNDMGSDRAAAPASCGPCLANKLGFCAMIRGKVESQANDHPGAPLLIGSVHTIPARRTICQPNEWSEFVTIICDGWATSSLALPDGRRQIVSFLLPGDLVSWNLFEPTSDRLIESVTDVTYRNFRRSDLIRMLRESPEFFEKLMSICVQYTRRADQRLLDLGRRTADERIARMILVLTNKLAKRGMCRDRMGQDRIDFPLRQHHIADAMGLTPVHVSKVLSRFRRDQLIEIDGRSLKVLDQTRLRRVATM